MACIPGYSWCAAAAAAAAATAAAAAPGAAAAGASVLTKLSQLAEAEREVHQRQQQLSEVEGQLRKLAAGAKEYKK
jgi:hypothetical protein